MCHFRTQRLGMGCSSCRIDARGRSRCPGTCGARRCDRGARRQRTQVEVRDPTRIVSIGGAVTEILYALGRERQVIAVDSTSFYPPQALREKPNVGYMRALSPEGVLGLGAVADPGHRRRRPAGNASRSFARRACRSSSSPTISPATASSRRSIWWRPRPARDAKANAWRRRSRPISRRSPSCASGSTTPRRVLFLLSFLNDRPMVAGRDTAADGIIRLAGAVNAMTEYEGYKLVERRGDRRGPAGRRPGHAAQPAEL